MWSGLLEIELESAKSACCLKEVLLRSKDEIDKIWTPTTQYHMKALPWPNNIRNRASL